ncbi:MAG: hydantoin utilization protein B, partial [Gemmobacter sp.]
RVDDTATAALRSAPRPEPQPYAFSPGRRAFEQVWTAERYAHLTAFLAAQPVGWRFFLKHRVFAAVAAGETDMPALFTRLRATYAL